MVSGQESCKDDNTEKSTDKVEDRGCKVEPLQAEYPGKDFSPEPEPPQQSRLRLLTKGEREHLLLRSKGQ